MASTRNVLEELRLHEGEILFRQDEAASRIYIIRSGHLRLTRRVFREEILVETLSPGNVCGEAAFAPSSKYPVTATALDQVSVAGVGREEMEASLFAQPLVAQQIARKLAARQTQLHFRLGSMALRSHLGRLMLQLRYEAIRHGALGGDAVAPLPYDLPEVLATERGRLDEGIRQLAAEQVIELNGNGQFRITDPAGFDRMLSWLELNDRFGKSE